MTEDEAVVFVSRLTVLAELLSEPMTPVRLAGYQVALADLDANDLADALNDCAKTCRFFPKPVEIRLRVGAIVDAREMRYLRTLREADEEHAAAFLPERTEPDPPQPEPTPEERADREARIEAGWQALFSKAKSLASAKAMPEPSTPSQTEEQIRRWRESGGA